MKALSIGVGLVGFAALVLAVTSGDAAIAPFGAAALLCAFATLGSLGISSFLKIFVGIFSTETVVFGVAALAGRVGLWPADYADYLPPDSLPLTVAIFSIVVCLVSRLNVVRQITRIADRYFEAGDLTTVRIWPLPTFAATERTIGIAMVVFLVLINQAQVVGALRLSFFRRDWFDAIQNYDGAAFWYQLMLVFTPWAFGLVAMGVVEFFTQFMLVIRWRRWLSDHFVARWLGSHAHYRVSLGSETDNPDQRIAEDVFRFINGGADGSTSGYGLYDFSILLISKLSSAVSFSILLWVMSAKFTMPGVTIPVPGFLFWVAFVYALSGTVIVHWIGRPLIGLFFERQHMEADFRFSLARLREYTEQIALLGGEGAERHMVGQRFGTLIGNFLAVVYRQMKVKVFSDLFGQVSPILPYVMAAPFFFARVVQLGDMTQAADAFGNLTDALVLFVTYYPNFAGFKSVVDRLGTFDQALDDAQAKAAGPALQPAPAGAARISLDDVDVALPDGRHAVRVRDLALAQGENVLIMGPSGAGKSTLFRTIAGIWPFGAGRIRVPAGARVMVVPQRPYIPIAPLRAAVTYPSPPGAYGDDAIVKALEDVHLGGLAAQLDREDVWSQRLSGGEQQRVAIARALLMRPDWLFLDESTSGLDEKAEAMMYRLLAERLPATTIISIAHRPTIAAFHHRRLGMAPEGDHFTLQDAARVAAE